MGESHTEVRRPVRLGAEQRYPGRTDPPAICLQLLEPGEFRATVRGRDRESGHRPAEYGAKPLPHPLLRGIRAGRLEAEAEFYAEPGLTLRVLQSTQRGE